MTNSGRLNSYVHASRIYTGHGIRKKDGRRVNHQDLSIVEDGALVHDSEKILWLGPTSKLPNEYLKLPHIDLQKRQAITPGWVDCHTHIVFAGDRSEEFSRRCQGVTYQQIASEGGGILKTMRETRLASEDTLYNLAKNRVIEAKKLGVRTLEIKSGYGLDLQSEIKSLRVVRRLRADFPDMLFQATLLAAHAIPPEFQREEYIDFIINDLLPLVGKEKLADACDIFVDEGYFTLSDAERLLKAAKKMGLKFKIHGDELADTNSALWAVEHEVLSVDHLLKINDRGIQSLASSKKTVGVLLPGTAYYLKTDYAPARKLLDAGAAIALASDFNPGTCMCNHLPSIMNMAALYMKMSCAEIFAAVTYNASKALDLNLTQGTIELGLRPSLTVLPFESFEECYYRFAWTDSTT